MPDIIVQRGSGASQGDDIVDALLTSEAACLARGRVELDDGSGTHPVQVNCVHRDGLLLGMMVELFDPLTMRQQYGPITSITHQIEGADVYSVLRVKVPSEFVV